MTLLILALAISLTVSAAFTTAELALFSLGDSRIQPLIEKGFGGSHALVRLRAAPEELQALLRLGNALADVTGVAMAIYMASRLWPGWSILVVVPLVATLVLLVGELLPRALVGRYGVRLSMVIAPALLLLIRVLRPLLSLLSNLSTATSSDSRNSGEITEEEVRQLTELGRAEGVIEEHESQLIERAFRLDETRAWEIMTPRVDMFAWPAAHTLAEVAPQFGSVPFSRVPIYGESIDNIVGVLYLRDAYQALITGQRDVALRDLAREPLIVPGSLPLTRLLQDFQNRRIHLAIVVDEYGGTDGLVTLEDVIEELVGEIVDETDVDEESITRISRSEIVADGDADLREINHMFNTAFPLLEHRSLNGYLLEELGHVPQPGESLEREGILFQVVEASETQILRARLTRVAPTETPLGGEIAVEPRTEEGVVASSETAAVARGDEAEARNGRGEEADSGSETGAGRDDEAPREARS